MESECPCFAKNAKIFAKNDNGASSSNTRSPRAFFWARNSNTTTHLPSPPPPPHDPHCCRSGGYHTHSRFDFHNSFSNNQRQEGESSWCGRHFFSQSRVVTASSLPLVHDADGQVNAYCWMHLAQLQVKLQPTRGVSIQARAVPAQLYEYE